MLINKFIMGDTINKKIIVRKDKFKFDSIDEIRMRWNGSIIPLIDIYNGIKCGGNDTRAEKFNPLRLDEIYCKKKEKYQLFDAIWTHIKKEYVDGNLRNHLSNKAFKELNDMPYNL